MKIKSTKNPELDIYSRYDRQKENVELQNFTNFLDLFSLSQFLDEIFYDSGCDMAFYKFRVLPPCIEHKIKSDVDDLADIALSQYEDSWGPRGMVW